jgi:hypothetical protein
MGLIRLENQGSGGITRRSERATKKARRALAEVLRLFADPVRRAVRG